MADDLSKGDVSSFETTASQVFGPQLNITYLPDLQVGDSRRDLSAELRL
eukprot:COSAG02_NODE_10816_length_1852_cov_3.233885_1_plen_48_part_10